MHSVSVEQQNGQRGTRIISQMRHNSIGGRHWIIGLNEYRRDLLTTPIIVHLGILMQEVFLDDFVGIIYIIVY